MSDPFVELLHDNPNATRPRDERPSALRQIVRDAERLLIACEGTALDPLIANINAGEVSLATQALWLTLWRLGHARQEIDWHPQGGELCIGGTFYLIALPRAVLYLNTAIVRLMQDPPQPPLSIVPLLREALRLVALDLETLLRCVEAPPAEAAGDEDDDQGEDDVEPQGDEDDPEQASNPAGGAGPLPEFMSARELAGHFELSLRAVESFLGRYRADYPDSFIATETPRRNDPRFLHRTAEVVPHLKRHFHLTLKDG
jgi:hypothetical protein